MVPVLMVAVLIIRTITHNKDCYHDRSLYYEDCDKIRTEIMVDVFFMRTATMITVFIMRTGIISSFIVLLPSKTLGPQN